jgi:hypothetical protein
MMYDDVLGDHEFGLLTDRVLLAKRSDKSTLVEQATELTTFFAGRAAQSLCALRERLQSRPLPSARRFEQKLRNKGRL